MDEVDPLSTSGTVLSRRSRYLATALLGVTAVGLGLIASPEQSIGRDQVLSLLNTGETVLGQPIAYPKEGPAKVTAAIVTMLPGEETGWHKHEVPAVRLCARG